MRRTRLSLYYLAGYLLPAGVLLIAAPEFALRLLLSNGTYGDVMPRLVGVVLLALGVIIVQIIRLKVERLYPTTVLVRLLILAVLASLYLYSSDPFFLVLVAIVGLGVVLTGTFLILERRSTAA